MLYCSLVNICHFPNGKFHIDLDNYLVHCLPERIGMYTVGVFGLRHCHCDYGFANDHNVVIRTGTQIWGQLYTDEGLVSFGHAFWMECILCLCIYFF